MPATIRKATLRDIPTLEVLIPESVRVLLAGYHTVQQNEGALDAVFGVDTQLIRDSTYFVAEVVPNIVGCAADGACERPPSAAITHRTRTTRYWTHR